MKHFKKKKIKSKLSIENMTVLIFKEGDIFVAYMPALDLTTNGDTFEDALKMAKEASLIFIEECIRMGTLEEVCASLGWQKINKNWIPPAFIAQQSLDLNLPKN